MLAATSPLARSAISATRSPRRMPRQISTALCAPGKRSADGAPNTDPIIVRTSDFLLLTYHKGRNLPSARGHIRQTGRAQARQITGELAAEDVRREVHEHVARGHPLG